MKISSSAWKPDLIMLLALAVSLLAGSLTFQHYGGSWDEPIFYQYANAIRQAYSLPNLLHGIPDNSEVYGPSPEDHRTYGPAYLLAGRLAVGMLHKVTRLPLFTLWHWVNFTTYLAGAGLFYLLSKRWLSAEAALFAALLFLTQPLLWGHAFINPKDIPFMTLFLASVFLGFRMVDNLCYPPAPAEDGSQPGDLPSGLPALLQRPSPLSALLLFALPAGLLLGVTASVRVVGPLAGALVVLYFLLKPGRRSLLDLAFYALAALLALYLAWPYLWNDPLNKLIKVVFHMANNQVTGPVLFNGQIYLTINLPRAYLPTLLALTLTPPVWLLVLTWLPAAAKRLGQDTSRSLLPVLLWFLVPCAYVVLRTPPMYDGYRHFLFILPPLFILAGMAFEQAAAFLRTAWLRLAAAFILLLPGLLGLIYLHPYQYTYYNSLAALAGGAPRRFETDYWLTCYKESVERLNAQDPQPNTLNVYWNPDLARQYAGPNLSVRGYYPENDPYLPPGALLLLTTRANADLDLYPDHPALFTAGRSGAVFCVLKEIQGQ